MGDAKALKPCRVPAASTQCYKLLRAMQDGRRLMIWNAMFELGVGALHQRVRELRQMGWPVKREEVNSANGKRVAQFWIGC